MLKDSSVHKVGVKNAALEKQRTFLSPWVVDGKKYKLTLRKQTPTPALLYYRQVRDLNLYYLCGIATPSQKNDYKICPHFFYFSNSKKKITKSCQIKTQTTQQNYPPKQAQYKKLQHTQRHKQPRESVYTSDNCKYAHMK